MTKSAFAGGGPPKYYGSSLVHWRARSSLSRCCKMSCMPCMDTTARFSAFRAALRQDLGWRKSHKLIANGYLENKITVYSNLIFENSLFI